MATLAAGNHIEVYAPLEYSITITPGSGGHVEFGCSSPSATPPAPRRIHAAESITIPPGSTIFMRAEGADATYLEPSSGSSTVITSYTAAQLAAMALAGTLTLNAWYVASDSGAWGLATAVNVIAWIDFDALALAMDNGIATYAAGEIEALAGLPNISDLIADAELTTYPRSICLHQNNAGSGPLTQAAATWTSPNASDNGSGKLRMSTTGDSDGVHGLATVGQKIYITFATTGSGLHEIATVVDTKTIDFTTDYSAVSGAPTVYLVGAASYGYDICTIPGGWMGANGSLDLAMLLSHTTTAGNKTYRIYLGASQVSEGNWTTAGEVSGHAFTRICNRNSEASQMGVLMKANNTTVNYSTTIDTTADAVLSLRYQVATADFYCKVDTVRVNLTPGV